MHPYYFRHQAVSVVLLIVAHRVLDRDRTFNGIRDAVELGEDAIACSVAEWLAMDL